MEKYYMQLIQWGILELKQKLQIKLEKFKSC